MAWSGRCRDHGHRGDLAAVAAAVSADGLKTELERPHVVRHTISIICFWSTQSHVFDPAGPTGPTGLYGMVSGSLDGHGSR